MTCTLGIVDGESVILGADSAGGSGQEIYTLDIRKVFARGSYVMGYCGSPRVGQVLRYRVELPEPPAGGLLEPFLVSELVPAIRDGLDREGLIGPGRAVLGEKTTLLLGCRGQLWCVTADLTVVPEAPFAAIGSGRHQAYGALHALHEAGVESPQRRLELALAAAAAYMSNVRPPWHFVRGGPR